MSVLVENKKKSSFFYSDGFRKGTALLYGLGASIVILGALFKILHWPYANEMLIIGMGTEALIFLVSAFEPIPDLDVHYEWEKVYPALASEEDYGGGLDEPSNVNVTPLNTAAADNLNKSMEAINKSFTPDLFESLSLSIKGLSSNVTNLGEIADAASLTNDYAKKVKEASSKIDEMSKGYATTLEAINSFSSSINDVKSYQEQVVNVTKNLTQLNAVYELELQDTQSHLKNVSKFYGSLANVMNNLIDTSKEAEALKQEVSSLTKNMSSLNRIYGSMLAAMATATKDN